MGRFDPRLRAHFPGVWRTPQIRTKDYGEVFGQVKREGPRSWRAELRRPSGDLVRDLGPWRSCQDAVDEIFSFDKDAG